MRAALGFRTAVPELEALRSAPQLAFSEALLNVWTQTERKKMENMQMAARLARMLRPVAVRAAIGGTTGLRSVLAEWFRGGSCFTLIAFPLKIHVFIVFPCVQHFSHVVFSASSLQPLHSRAISYPYSFQRYATASQVDLSRWPLLSAPLPPHTPPYSPDLSDSQRRCIDWAARQQLPYFAHKGVHWQGWFAT